VRSTIEHRTFSSSAFSTKPGKCFRLHVGVNAPGTAKRTTCGAALVIFIDGTSAGFVDSVKAVRCEGVHFEGCASILRRGRGVGQSTGSACRATHLLALRQLFYADVLHVAIRIKVAEFVLRRQLRRQCCCHISVTATDAMTPGSGGVRGSCLVTDCNGSDPGLRSGSHETDPLHA